MPMASARFQLGRWTVDPDRNRLTDGASAVRIEHTVMRLLVWLAAHPDRDLTRAEILAGVWGPGVHSDEVLNVAISALRRALGDSVRSPEYVKTVPRTGYRLITPPLPIGDRAPSAGEAPPASRWSRPLFIAVLLAGLVLTVALAQVLVELVAVLRSS